MLPHHAPEGMVGVVRASHCIDVEALHEANISNHRSQAHSLALDFVVLMTVNAYVSRGHAWQVRVSVRVVWMLWNQEG